MGFPDRIERTVELAHPPGKVWAALTTAEGLAAWFGDEATIDLRPGGSARMVWTGRDTGQMRGGSGGEATGVGFTRQIEGVPEEGPRRTSAGVTLGPAGRGPAGAGTRLKVVESGFAQLPAGVDRKVYDGHTEGWALELGELAGYLDAT